MKKLHFENIPLLVRFFDFLLRASFTKVIGMRNAMDVRLNEVDFAFDNLPAAFDNTRILLLTDLHIDGMDGLAGGAVAMVALVLAVLCYVASETMTGASTVTWAAYLLLPHVPQSGELCVFYSAIVGSLLGFLWYNTHPAQAFMGDVGSLPLGAAMGYGALVTRNEVLLLVIGGVFVMELLSVLLQIGYFKYTGGKRLFRCAPIHHHFHLAGWSEPQVVVRFWLLGAAFAALALATLKIR